MAEVLAPLICYAFNGRCPNTVENSLFDVWHYLFVNRLGDPDPTRKNKTKSRQWNRKVYKGTECRSGTKRSLCTKAKVRELLIDIREPLLRRMREKLFNKKGALKYFKRQYTIEPLFGHLKYNLGYRSFLLRGVEKVKAEFKLMCIGWNLKKMLKMGIKPVRA